MSLYDDSRKSGPESSFETFYDPTLYGWPANVHGDTQHFQSLGPRILQKQTESLYFSATGETLDETETITEGHKHDAWSTLLRWRQLGSWRPQGGFFDDAKHGFVHALVEPRSFLWASFSVPFNDANLVERYVIPRYRISNPAPGASTPCTMLIRSTFYWDDGGDLTVLGAAPADVYVTSTSSVTFSDVWIEGPAVDLNVADVSNPLFWRLELSTDTDGPEVAVHEVQLGWLQG